MGVSVPSKSIFESLSAAERRRKRLGVSLEYLESIAFVPARAALRVRAIDVTDQAAASSCVVIAPHPDDETLGCGAIIARKRAAGTNVRVVIVTDGRRSHRSDKIPVHRLIALRRKEAIEACGVLGVSEDKISFLEVEDQSIGSHREEISRELAELIGRAAPDEVYSPLGLDRNADHQALAEIVRDLAGHGMIRSRILEYPVWFWTLRTWLGRGPITAGSIPGLLAAPLRAALLSAPRTIRADEYLETKRAALAKHRTQIENLTGEPTWNTLDPRFLRHFFRPYELFFQFRACERGDMTT